MFSNYNSSFFFFYKNHYSTIVLTSCGVLWTSWTYRVGRGEFCVFYMIAFMDLAIRLGLATGRYFIRIATTLPVWLCIMWRPGSSPLQCHKKRPQNSWAVSSGRKKAGAGDSCHEAHVTLMWHSCGTHVALMWHSCGTHVALMWHSCGTHVALMWYSWGIHVVLMWHSCTHITLMWHSELHHYTAEPLVVSSRSLLLTDATWSLPQLSVKWPTFHRCTQNIRRLFNSQKLTSLHRIHHHTTFLSKYTIVPDLAVEVYYV